MTAKTVFASSQQLGRGNAEPVPIKGVPVPKKSGVFGLRKGAQVHPGVQNLPPVQIQKIASSFVTQATGHYSNGASEPLNIVFASAEVRTLDIVRDQDWEDACQMTLTIHDSYPRNRLKRSTDQQNRTKWSLKFILKPFTGVDSQYV